MPQVDSKGRIVIPKDIREDMDLSEGTEVKVREEDDSIVIERERDPEDILERMEQLIDEASHARDERDNTVDDSDMHPLAQKHEETVRRNAQRADDE